MPGSVESRAASCSSMAVAISPTGRPSMASSSLPAASPGVALPVILSVAQFGSPGTTAVLGTLLIAAQTYVGNILEPKMIGRQLNLSPFVILVALSVWSSVWGLAGAILAIPMTSVLAIICGSFASTRFIAVLLADTVDPALPESATAKSEPDASQSQ